MNLTALPDSSANAIALWATGRGLLSPASRYRSRRHAEREACNWPAF